MDLLLNLIIGGLGILASVIFYLLGKRDAKRIVAELRSNSESLRSYSESQTAYLNRLVKQLEAQGAMQVVQGADGNPADVQIVRAGFEPSEEKSYGAAISLGPPPQPPEQLNLSAPLRISASLSGKVIRQDGTEEHFSAD